MVERAHVCAVVLAAGEGLRLRPLTLATPKALCPVGNVPLLDRTLDALEPLGLAGPASVAVNAWSHAAQVVTHVGGRAHVSVEAGDRPLGTAGGVGALRSWIGDRHVLVANADAYLAGGAVAPLLDDWDGREVRLLGVPAGDRAPEFGAHLFAGVSLLPASIAGRLTPEPGDLVRLAWRPAEAAGLLSVVDYGGTFIDSGSPASYLAANLDAARRTPGGSIIEPTARVRGTVTHSVVGAAAIVAGGIDRAVVWPGSVVAAGEQLTEVIRYGIDGTVDARVPRNQRR